MVHHAAFGLPIESLDVIVIDDSRPMQTILRSILSAFAVGRTRVYDNVEDAFEAMLAEPPNVVITDWKMKPISGYQLIKSIRQRAMSPLCFIPVMLVTAHGTRALVDKAFRAGAHQFMVKPVSPTTLQQRLYHLTQDDREFILEGDSYVIEGVEELLDAHHEKWEALEHARRQRDVVKRTEGMQNTVDRYVSGALDEADLPPDLATPILTEPPPPKPRTTVPGLDRPSWPGARPRALVGR